MSEDPNSKKSIVLCLLLAAIVTCISMGIVVYVTSISTLGV